MWKDRLEKIKTEFENDYGFIFNNLDISFYINKNFFDFKNLNIPNYFEILKFLKTDIYGNIIFYKTNAQLNIFTEERNYTNIDIDLK